MYEKDKDCSKVNCFYLQNENKVYWTCNSKYCFKFNLLLSCFLERLYIRELDFSALVEQNEKYFFQLWVLNGEMINKNEAKSEISMIFVQVTSRLKEFLIGWLLVLGLKECLVECATVCFKSVVILNDFLNIKGKTIRF